MMRIRYDYRRIFVAILTGAQLLMVFGIMAFAHPAYASKTSENANSFCTSFVGGSNDPNYKPCTVYYIQAVQAKINGTLATWEKTCQMEADTTVCSAAIAAGVARYTKSPSPGAGASKGASPGPASGCAGSCIDAGSVGIPKVYVGSGLRTVVDILSFIAGVLSAIFLIVGGIRYATSEGSSDRINRAKQTLTYGILGLIISILASAIVGFVITRGPQ